MATITTAKMFLMTHAVKGTKQKLGGNEEVLSATDSYLFQVSLDL